MLWSLGFKLLDLGFLLFCQFYDLNPEELADLIAEMFLRCFGSPHRTVIGFSKGWMSKTFHAPTAIHQSNPNKYRIIKLHGELGHSLDKLHN